MHNGERHNEIGISCIGTRRCNSHRIYSYAPRDNNMLWIMMMYACNGVTISIGKHIIISEKPSGVRNSHVQSLKKELVHSVHTQV